MRLRGPLLGLCLAGAALLAPDVTSANTIVVDSDEDDVPTVVNGDCTLREAISSVGSIGVDDCEDGDDAAIDKIVFDDLPAGPQVIDADRHFILNSVMEIDASGHDGEVRIDGSSAASGFRDHGIQPRADNIRIEGLSVTNWDQTGIKVDTNNNGTDAADGVQLIDNFIGTDEAGTTGLGNGSFGVTVGLPAAGATREPDGTVISGNVISGNGNGIGIRGDLTQNTTVSGNLIGTTPAGTAALGNTL